MAMLDLRATPADSKLPSSTATLMGRAITTLLPYRTSQSPLTLAQHLTVGAQTVNSDRIPLCI